MAGTAEPLEVTANGRVRLNGLGELSCRSCRYFLRIAAEDEQLELVHERQGFCMLGGSGNGAGDYSPYTYAPVCDRWVPSAYARETCQAEKQLRELYARLEKNTYDGRTREYKLLREYIDRAKAGLAGEGLDRWPFLAGDAARREGVRVYVKALCPDRLRWLQKRKHLDRSEYLKAMGFVRAQVFDRLKVCADEPDIAVIDADAQARGDRCNDRNQGVSALRRRLPDNICG